MPGRQVLNDAEAKAIGVDPDYFKDCSDGVLITTRGGVRYDRTFMEGFLVPGIGPENWVSRTNYPALNVVQTGPNAMSFYANQNYGQPTSHLRRYSLRLDGFACVRALYCRRRIHDQAAPLRRPNAPGQLRDVGRGEPAGRDPGRRGQADPRLRPRRRERDDRQRDRSRGAMASGERCLRPGRQAGAAEVRDEGCEPLCDAVRAGEPTGTPPAPGRTS